LDKRNGDMFEVLMTSTSYPEDNADWRGRFIADLLKSISKDKRVRIRLWAPPGLIPLLVHDAKTPLETSFLERLMADGGIAAILRKKNLSSLKTVCLLLLFLTRVYHRNKSAHLVHSHWLQNALPLLGSRQPAVISVLGSDLGLLRVPGMTILLRAVLKTRPCLIAPNASWMAPRLREAFGDLAEIRPIPFGVSKEWFKIKRSTEQLKIGRWIVVSRMTPEKLGPLFAWFETLFKKKPELHLFGPASKGVSLPSWATFHGPVTPRDLKEIWYPSAVALLTLSEHDEGRPQVILEAMASGVPVIASDMPAHRDVILHRKTGWLVSNVDDFHKAFVASSDTNTNLTTGNSARTWVKQNIGTWDDCAARFIKAYQDVMTGKI
jgi:glycosyltransferase involved in cell wall biosynthesis